MKKGVGRGRKEEVRTCVHHVYIMYSHKMYMYNNKIMYIYVMMIRQ